MVLPACKLSFSFKVKAFVEEVFVIPLPERNAEKSYPFTILHPVDHISFKVFADYMRLTLELATPYTFRLLDVDLHSCGIGVQGNQFPRRCSHSVESS